MRIGSSAATRQLSPVALCQVRRAINRKSASATDPAVAFQHGRLIARADAGRNDFLQPVPIAPVSRMIDLAHARIEAGHDFGITAPAPTRPACRRVRPARRRPAPAPGPRRTRFCSPVKEPGPAPNAMSVESAQLQIQLLPSTSSIIGRISSEWRWPARSSRAAIASRCSSATDSSRSRYREPEYSSGSDAGRQANRVDSSGTGETHRYCYNPSRQREARPARYPLRNRICGFPR